MGSYAGAAKRVAAAVGLTLDEYLDKLKSGEKWCTGCKSWHHKGEFGPDKSRPDGLASTCARRRGEMRVSRQRRARVSKLGAFFVEARDGDREQARSRVNHRVKTGLIPHPNQLPCVDCGHVWLAGERRHEYDHHKGYSAQHQLDVEPVCTQCHRVRSERRGELRQERGNNGRYKAGGKNG